MNGPRYCPNCNSDFRGKPIPEKHFQHKENCPLPEGTKHFPGECFCLPYGDRKPEDRFWSNLILVEIRGVYDGGLFYRCPNCAHDFHRWEDPAMRAKAEPHMNKDEDE